MMEGFKSLGDYGVTFAALAIFFMLVKLFIDDKRAVNTLTNQTLQENTKALNKLANTLEKSSVRDEAFRAELLKLVQETNTDVKEIHRKVVSNES